MSLFKVPSFEKEFILFFFQKKLYHVKIYFSVFLMRFKREKMKTTLKSACYTYELEYSSTRVFFMHEISLIMNERKKNLFTRLQQFENFRTKIKSKQKS